MVLELVFRFILGGLIVSAFAVLGDILQPKSLGGIFGAAPSVALASLGLTFALKGRFVAALDGRAMTLGAVALGIYCLSVAALMHRAKWNTFLAGSVSILVWLGVAFGLQAVFLR